MNAALHEAIQQRHSKNARALGLIIVNTWGNAWLVRTQQPLPPMENVFTEHGAYWACVAKQLNATNASAALRGRVSGALAHYHPLLYLEWGRFLLRENAISDAGKFFLLSGSYSDAEVAAVNVFKQRCQRMTPHQVLREFPRPTHRREARMRFPERVYQDCANIPCPIWWRAIKPA